MEWWGTGSYPSIKGDTYSIFMIASQRDAIKTSDGSDFVPWALDEERQEQQKRRTKLLDLIKQIPLEHLAAWRSS